VSLLAILAALGAGLSGLRLLARTRRSYVRLMVDPYRGDRTRPDALLATITALHSLVAARGPRRLFTGQPSLALEVHLHHRRDGAPLAWLAISVPRGLERQAQAALRSSYPNAALRPVAATLGPGGGVVRLHKRAIFTAPVRRLADVDSDRPPVERLLRAMAAAAGSSAVQLALTPAPLLLGRPRRPSPETVAEPPAEALADREPLPLNTPFFYGDIRLIGDGQAQLSAIAAELRLGTRANRLVARRLGSARRRLFARRIARGEGNPFPSPPRRTYAAEEIAALWQLPSIGFAAVPYRRRPTPLAPAPAGILRVSGPGGLVADEHGPVTIHPALRRQNTAVVGTVEQGKTSYLVASVREDLRRPDCAVIVLDPKGDAADAALSAVPDRRVCTLLDLARPTCGFNPLAVRAPIDAIADYVVAALRQLFADGEVRGSSDRYLRNALIAALAYDRRASLWDVARLLEVGPAGVALRARVAHRLVAQPEFAEVVTFLAEELPGQLADARATTTAKLDAPANKLARVLNSSSVKRVLLNDSLTVDFDRLIDRREVLIVRGALGELGPGNVSVLMQLLVGMLDAALARAQDRRRDGPATAVALKVDEAPLVINPSFAQTLALKRSAGLETVACWQTDAQWPPELRDQLDALFAHRVLFATASAVDARAAAGLLMAEFSDQLRSGDQPAAGLAAPDVRLHLPRHTAIVSWTTPGGRERPFLARTLPLVVDRDRIDRIARTQRARGGREGDGLAPPPRLELLPPDPPAAVGPTGDGPPPGERPPPGPTRPVPAPRPPAARSTQPVPAPRRPAGGASRPESAPEPGPQTMSPPPPSPPGYAELCALDAATRVRWLPVSPSARRPTLDAGELELLAWIAAARCALSSQAHRRLSPGRALTSTQRRLKRLADAGLLARFQLHGGDGGGVPFGCAATAPALELLGVSGRRPPVLSDAALDGLRADIHAVGWLLALEARAGGALVSLLGPGRARLAPGAGPAALDLGPGVHARDFLTGDPDGARRPVDRFLPLTPAAVAELRVVENGGASTADLLLFHAPADSGQAVALLERCDHLIAGWWRLHPRYARLGSPPTAVILCPDPDRALALAGLADRVLLACLARIGQAPAEWAHPGREGVVFVAERDLHDGSLLGWRVPPLGPATRPDGAAAPRRQPILGLAEPARTGARVAWS
jgi:hypothetical protein